MTALSGAGCASTTEVPPDGAQWRRVTSVDGCVGPRSRWAVPGHTSIRLQPEFQATLIGQLNQQSLENPYCWYQIPSGDLLLRAGSICGLSHEAQFHQDGSRWTVVRNQQVLGQCGT